MCFNRCVMWRSSSAKKEQSVNLKLTEESKFGKKARLNLTDLLQRRQTEKKEDKKIILLITLGIIVLILTVLAIISL